MGGKIKEACGRCSMSSVVDMVGGDDEAAEGAGRNPFDGARIEVPEDQLRKVAFPAVWLGRVKHRLDEIATQLTYGGVE